MNANYMLFLCLLLVLCSTVDESKFRKCSDAGFCSRHRSKPMKLHYSIDESSVTMKENVLTATLLPSRQQTTNLILALTVLKNDVIRVHAIEENPLDGRERYEINDILIPEYTEPQTMKLALKTSEKVVVMSENGHSRVEISYNPIYIAYFVDDELKISMNDKDLFYFEVTRRKEVHEVSDPEIVVEDTHEKRIVDYTEAGHAIYDDGSTEDDVVNEGVSSEESVMAEEPKEEHVTNEEKEAEEPKEEHATNEEKEDETGYWEEYFGGKMDKKPYGPQSVGSDITFHGVEALYGIPQHSSSVLLKTTVNGPYTQPYRLFNLDVFEYATDKPSSLYGSIPFLLGHSKTRTVGMLWMNPSDTFIDIYAREGEKQSTQWMFEAGVMDIYFFPGGSPADLLNQYTQLSSRPYLPPYFSLGYHQSRWNYLDEKDVREVNDKFESLNFPYDVIWLDIEHTIGKKYFTWDKSNFPNPREMIAYVASKGHKMVTVVDPHVKREAGYAISDEMKKRDFLIKGNNGEVFEGWCWPGSSNYPDYTDKRVRDFWGERFDPQYYEGSCDDLYTWNDMNEPSVFDGPEVTMPLDTVNLAGHEHREWHNVYGYYYHNANMQGQLMRSPHQRPFVLTRSTFVGSQRNGAMWTGDIFSNFEHLKATIPMLLSLGLGGIPFSGSDVPGFFKDPTEEVATRWYQFGAWMPFFRAHAHIDTKRREPWTFSTPTFHRIRNAVIERYAYLPYTYTLMWESSRTGAPLTRPLFWHYPQDEKVYSEDYSYLYGEHMLIIPVTAASVETMETYFPSDSWMNIYDYSIVEGGKMVTISTPIDHIGVYQRAGSIVPQQLRLRRSALQSKLDPFTYVIVATQEGEAEGMVYHDDRDGFGYKEEQYAAMKIVMKGKRIVSTRIGGKNYSAPNTVERIVIHNTGNPTAIIVAANGRSYSATFLYDESIRALTIRKPDVLVTGDWTIILY